VPELPEIETVKRGLEPALQGQVLRRVILNRPDLRFPFPLDFAKALEGRRVAALSRRAKYMLWHLDSGAVVLLHLGMSGRFTFAEPDTPIARHDHVIFKTASGLEVRYNDPRRFGFMDLIRPGEGNRFLDSLGPEPLGNAFNGPYLFDQLRDRKAAVKARLLDQRVVVGVGNIYCSEALFQAGIRPTQRSDRVTKAEAERLVLAIKDVLTRAIAAGGSSLRDYIQADGELGYFQHAWAVYGREGQACLTCGTPITRLVQSNRSSFFCKTCQV